MQRRRPQIVVGAALLAPAASMIAGFPSLAVWAVFLVGLFLLIWGIAPLTVERGVAALPCSARLNSWLGAVDRWLAGSAGSRSQSLDKLSYEMDRGLQLLNQDVASEGELAAWDVEQSQWIDSVFQEIEVNFSRAQAITFRSVGSVMDADMPPYFSPWHNMLKLHLDKRIDNLRHFLNSEAVKL